MAVPKRKKSHSKTRQRNNVSKIKNAIKRAANSMISRHYAYKDAEGNLVFKGEIIKAKKSKTPEASV